MKIAGKAARTTGLALFFVVALPLAGSYGELAFDTMSFLCIGAPGAEAAHAAGAMPDEGAPHGGQEGLYMPMFSTPPKGGKTYNGPPLDEC